MYWTGQLPVKKEGRLGRTGGGSDAVAGSQSCPYGVTGCQRASSSSGSGVPKGEEQQQPEET